MSNQLIKLYENRATLGLIQENFDIFYQEWMKSKCQDYDMSSLSAYYDIFFSRFVTYNAIYNTYTNIIEQFGVKSKRKTNKGKDIERGDREKAVTIMSKSITNVALNDFFSHPEVIEDIKTIIEIIESKEFVITYKHGEPKLIEDEQLKVQLMNNQHKIKIESILTILYNIRCNMFHGSKNFEYSQKKLLKPLNRLLINVVEMSNKELRNTINKLLVNIEKSINEINL